MLRWIRASCAVVLVGAITVLPAPGETERAAEPFVRALESRYRSVRTLRAAFLEQYRDSRSGAYAEAGTVYFRRDGRMRWEYESPEEKLFLTDGKTAWFYVPADRTVTRAPMKESSDWRTPLALLAGRVDLSRLCEHIGIAGEPAREPANVVLSCRPKGAEEAARRAARAEGGGLAISGPSEEFQEVLLELNPNTGELGRVRVLEPGGVELEYRFGNWVEDLPLADSLFRFEVPPGVAIVEETAAEASR